MRPTFAPPARRAGETRTPPGLRPAVSRSSDPRPSVRPNARYRTHVRTVKHPSGTMWRTQRPPITTLAAAGPARGRAPVQLRWQAAAVAAHRRIHAGALQRTDPTGAVMAGMGLELLCKGCEHPADGDIGAMTAQRVVGQQHEPDVGPIAVEPTPLVAASLEQGLRGRGSRQAVLRVLRRCPSTSAPIGARTSARAHTDRRRPAPTVRLNPAAPGTPASDPGRARRRPHRSPRATGR